MNTAPSLVGCGKPRNPTDSVSSSVNGDDKPFPKDGPVWPSLRSRCVGLTQRLGAHREPQMTPGWAEAAFPSLSAFRTGAPGSPLTCSNHVLALQLARTSHRAETRCSHVAQPGRCACATSSLGAVPSVLRGSQRACGRLGDALRDAMPSLRFACSLGLGPA